MVAPKFRSRSMKKLFRVTPGGRSTIIYKRAKPSKAVCAICGSKLNAVPNKRPSELGKLSKVEKRPERVFGGVLCHDCASQVLKNKARLASKVISKEDVSLKVLKFVNMLK